MKKNTCTARDEPQTEKGHHGAVYISSYLLSREISRKSARSYEAHPNLRNAEKTKIWDALRSGCLKTRSQSKNENRTKSVERKTFSVSGKEKNSVQSEERAALQAARITSKNLEKRAVQPATAGFRTCPSSASSTPPGSPGSGKSLVCGLSSGKPFSSASRFAIAFSASRRSF